MGGGSMDQTKILLVDDELKILDVVRVYLEKDKFCVFTASTGREALEVFHQEQPDLIILDLMLPDRSGEEVCSLIRKESEVPIIMLTAKINNQDVVQGFKIGADDYVPKPFRLNELVLRVHAILKRIQKLNPRITENSDRNYGYKSFLDGYLKINYEMYIVLVNDEEISLTPSEFKILSLLSRNNKRSFTRDQLIEFALDNECQGYDRTIDAFIKNIRYKIEKTPKCPKIITTVHGIGYRFDGDES